MRILQKNRYELYVSIIIVFFGILQTHHLPHDYRDCLVTSGTLAAGLFLEFNALLDIKRMHWVERWS